MNSEETMKEQKEKQTKKTKRYSPEELDILVEERANQKVASLLTVVDENMIMRVSQNGMVSIGKDTKKSVEPQMLTMLKQEADFIERSYLWKILYETPKKLAEETIFVNSQSLDDLKKGKSMLYTLSTQKKILDTFLSYVPMRK